MYEYLPTWVMPSDRCPKNNIAELFFEIATFAFFIVKINPLTNLLSKSHSGVKNASSASIFSINQIKKKIKSIKKLAQLACLV